MAFFCAKTNQWVTVGCTHPLAGVTPLHYPAFDPIPNRWISSGNHGDAVPTAYPIFCKTSNSWITAGKCP